MKAFGIIALLVSMAIAAYLVVMQLHSTPASAGGGQISANTIQVDEARAQAAAQQAKLQIFQTAIRSYQAQNGKYPASLDELRSAGVVDSIPDGMKYNAETGEVSF